MTTCAFGRYPVGIVLTHPNGKCAILGHVSGLQSVLVDASLARERVFAQHACQLGFREYAAIYL